MEPTLGFSWGCFRGFPKVVKNLPAYAGDIRDSVQSMGQKDPLEEGPAAHSSILAWRIPGTGAWWAAVYGVAESDMIDVT